MAILNTFHIFVSNTCKMKNILRLILVLCLSQQVSGQFTYNSVFIKTAPSAIIDMSEALPEYDPKLKLIQSANPLPANQFQQMKRDLDLARAVKLSGNNLSKKSSGKTGVPLPQLLKNFQANVTQGTPNDNDLAVSNGGTIISSVNTNVNFFNDTGKYISGKTLSGMASKLKNLDRTFDPRVLYDPEADRFILVFLQGSTSADTRIIIGFSQSNDPTKLWNFYSIPGNIFGDSSWSDYPIISITKDELFVTVNRVKDNTPWQVGFIESLIWQTDKNNGYKGDTLNQKVYTNIKYSGRSIWSICPVKGGSQSYGPGMQFFSVRPSDLSNDTVFMHEVTNTIASGNAKLTLKILKADKQYGLQPNAIQPSGKKLQTNDSRVLSAMYEDGNFYFVGNTIDTALFSPAFYLGIIDNYWSTSPSVKLKIISYDSLDIGYPSIAYCGGGTGDNSAIITFSHVSQKHFPGTSALFVDRHFNISGPIFVKDGEASIKLLSDSVERWGDYTGIQRKYNENGICWLNGSYGYGSGDNKTWVAKVLNKDPMLSINEKEKEEIINNMYPNPAYEYVNVDFEVKKKTAVEIEVMDQQGKVIPLLHDFAKAGINRFTFNVQSLANGIYFVNIKHENAIIYSKKLLVAH